MENLESLMASLVGSKIPISQEVKDALAASRESVKQDYGKIRDALRNHKKKMNSELESTALALPGTGGSIVKADGGNLPAFHGGDHGAAEVLKTLGCGNWGDMLEAAHDRALNTSADTGTPKLLSSMFFTRGGKDMFEKLKDSRSRNQVMAAILSRHLTEYEGISQVCTTMINEINLENIQDGFKNDGTTLQNILKTKLRIDAAQRASIQAMSKLGGVQSPGLNVRNVNQLNYSGVQQVRNETVVEDGENNITNSRKNTLPKHKRQGDLECTSNE